jgi:hypothetical protein
VHNIRKTDGYRLISGRSQDRNLLPASITHHRNGASRHWSIFNRGGAEEARGAHNPEVIGSNPISGIYHTSHWCIKALEHLIHRHGAEAARGAHNSEVTRSKRVAGIYHTSHWCIKALEHLITGVAQGQRARLITARTYDRNVSPVSITHRIGASRHWSIFTRCGAAAARAAHNCEDIRSKRIAGIRSARPQ